jgi:hypothetical protein
MFTELTANPSIIIVDNEKGESSGRATISYNNLREADPGASLWERYNDGSWYKVDLYKRVSTESSEAEDRGSFQVELKPGWVYDLAISFTSPDLPNIRVSCVWKAPESRRLISDRNFRHGGTWAEHDVVTTQPTRILCGWVTATRERVVDTEIPAPPPDAKPFVGVPLSGSVAGGSPAKLSTTHKDVVTHNGNYQMYPIPPMLPGNRYMTVLVVSDKFGNWQVLAQEFKTLRRKLDVSFPRIYAINDGDDWGTSEVRIDVWFNPEGGALSKSNPKVKWWRFEHNNFDDKMKNTAYLFPAATYSGPLHSVAGDVPWAPQIYVTGIDVDVFANEQSDIGGGLNDYDPIQLLRVPFGKGNEEVSNVTYQLKSLPVNVFYPDNPTGSPDTLRFAIDVVFSVDYAP